VEVEVAVAEEGTNLLASFAYAYEGGLAMDAFVLDKGIAVVEPVAMVVVEELAAVISNGSNDGTTEHRYLVRG